MMNFVELGLELVSFGSGFTVKLLMKEEELKMIFELDLP